MSLIEQIRELSLLPGVSSCEDAVRSYLQQVAEAAACQTETDALGNLIVYKKGKRPASPPILLTAHMDEVGLIITQITEEGYLHFDTVGKVDRRILLGKRVEIQSRPGVIGIKAIHLTEQEERKKLPPLDSLYIDIGAQDKAAAQKQLRPGDVACFHRSFCNFGAGLIKGSALTSRIPCAILLQLLSCELPCDCTLAFTTQKEVGSRGAFGAAFRIKPRLALVLDSTPACDTPNSKGAGIGLGDGVAICTGENGAMYDAALSRELLQLSEKEQLPARLLYTSTASQGAVLQSSGAGARVAVLKLPIRYASTPSCVANPEDARVALQLILQFLQSRG